MSSETISQDNSIHLFYLRQALDEARKCTHVPTAFCVGCVIVVYPDEISNLKSSTNSSQDISSSAETVIVSNSDGSKRIELDNGKKENKGIVLCTGYSRELPGNTHAEANALHKAHTVETLALPSTSMQLNPTLISSLLGTATVYTTLEPCSVRTSGLAPCANALVDAKVKEVVIGVGEPDDFVKCEGAKILLDAGVRVTWVKGLEEECLRVARGVFE